MTENFDEILYLEANPDVRQMLARGESTSALEHWRSTGANEHALGLRRSGFQDYDLVYDEATYLRSHEDVASALRAGLIRDGYEHWIRFGRLECAEGRRHDCFGTAMQLSLPFRVQASDGGHVFAGLVTRNLPPVERLDLSTDARTSVTLDPRSVVCSREIEVTDETGRVTTQIFVLFWVPAGPLVAQGQGPLTFTVTGTAGDLRIVTFSEVGEGPVLTTMDAARELVRAASRLSVASTENSAITRAMGNFAAERLTPPSSRRENQPYANTHVEHALSIVGAGIFTVGWLIPRNPLLERCRAFCPETGECVELQETLARGPRPDVRDAFRNEIGADGEDQFGFTSLLALPEASRLAECSVIFGITPRGGREQLMAPVKARTLGNFPDAARIVLSSLNPAATDFQALMTHAIGPSIEALWERERSRKSRNLTVRQFGERPREPAASVVVPIYGRSDFIRYQLALFANDEDFASGAVELIYFIDDPRLIEGLLQLCLGWAPMYRVPFSVAYTGNNHGFSGANNLGVSIARGDMVVLLNSDAMPKRSGWVHRMLAAYASTKDCGLLGAKLLYYDESLQHDGMIFEKFPFWNGLYGNNHPGKGLPNRDELDALPREVEAVTGACMAISRALYLEVGGLCEDFVLGDFEDSELCMRLRHAGKRVLYMPSEELYHLERQSQSLLPDGESWRLQLTVYNAWVQDRKWRAAIDRLKHSRLGAGNRESAG